MPPRILFSSLSAKLALYREVASDAQHFCSEAKVIACDSDPNCAASRDVDHFIFLPKISDLTNDELIEICKLHEISHVLPTRDGELLFWAQRKLLLAQHDIQVWVSNEECIQLCNDKLSFYESWKNCPIPAIPTYDTLPDNQVSRWVVKPRSGSGGRMHRLDLNYHEACKIASSFKHESIIQPFVSGREFSAEVWMSKEGRCYGPLLRWRNKVVKGESHLSTVFRNLEWEQRVRSIFLHRPGLFGHCLAQVLVEEDGTLNLVEINPRLGGASPLALRAGLTSISWHLLEEEKNLDILPKYPKIREGLFLEKKGDLVSFSMI